MATQNEILAREKDVTDKISTQVRTISAGLIVFTWSIYNAADNTLAAGMKNVLAPLFLVVDILCIAALSADFLQYVCAKVSVENSLNQPMDAAKDMYGYDDEWLSYKGQYWAFWAKIVLCGLAIVLACILTAYSLAVLSK
jgi:hypothetical protein